ncbi:methyl-accepting chemotaxis protein [Halarcobacter sp.]|uniref:methyl-accepting chemotaxis protein n=1 Tax=Halarcobacter sp. TaxID=2321133 RepID=UPI002AA89E78|nr:cache domain-containing protein [Halarcobacter sp.]
MKSVSIKFKILTLIISIIITMSILVLLISFYETKALTNIQIKQFEDKAYSQKEKELNSYIEIVSNILKKDYNKYGKEGKDNLLEQIRSIRFGENGYFWIHSLDLKMIMHPLNPELEGKDISKYKDENGKFIFKEMNKIALSKGDGIIKYYAPKPNEEKQKAKFSHVFLFKPLGWVIGTGAYVDDVEQSVSKMQKESISQTKSIILKISLLTIALIMFSYFVIIFVFNYVIKKPIVEFKYYFNNFLKFITLETNKYTPSEVHNKDEIGELMIMINNTANEFDKKLKDDMKVMGEVVLTADRIEQGIFRCNIHSESKNPMIMTLKKSLNKMLHVLNGNMERIKGALEDYESHNYTTRVPIDKKYKDTMLAVMNSINKLGETLGENAKSNLHNGETLEDNSTTMTNSMENLAVKANEQAASLEETAAAVEEITSITRGNAENATKMATLGKTVRDSVTTGEDLATKTALSMDEINEKVTAINEAINVIDQIAFQTNILSLNAAVEAATAGEAGKGFAVVAQEVRNLASRSAQAAKEIKELVEDANLKANEGKVISDNMIEGYKELNTHISETIHIIEDVSVASKEQMTGIEQINDTITMLDRVTQENANEANQVKEIAKEVSAMANELVQDAKNKRFN